jgi:hypothetical protein
MTSLPELRTSLPALRTSLLALRMIVYFRLEGPACTNYIFLAACAMPIYLSALKYSFHLGVLLNNVYPHFTRNCKFACR